MSEQIVVVGVDGSPASFTGLRWALAHAGRSSAQVRAIRCWEPVSAPRWESAVTAEPVSPSAKQQARAERELDEVVAAALAQVPDCGARVVVQQRVARGPAGPVLVIPPAMATRRALVAIAAPAVADAGGSYSHDHAAGSAAIGRHLHLVEEECPHDHRAELASPRAH